MVSVFAYDVGKKLKSKAFEIWLGFHHDCRIRLQ